MTILYCPECKSENVRQPDRDGTMPITFHCYNCGLHAEKRVWTRPEKEETK